MKKKSFPLCKENVEKEKLPIQQVFENEIWLNLCPYTLKSVNSNFTLEVHSPKLGQAKTHFLSHFGEKENMARPGFEPTISRSEADSANHYS